MNFQFLSKLLQLIRSTTLGLLFVSGTLLIPSHSKAWEPREATVSDPVREQVEYHNEIRPAVERNIKEANSGGTKTDKSGNNNYQSRASQNSNDDDDDDDNAPTRSPHSTSPTYGNFHDPWAAYKEYDAGEAGDRGDLDTHHNAIQRAITIADSCPSCAASNFSDDRAGAAARQAVINSIYAQEIKREYDRVGVPENQRNIPAGPLAAAAKYVHNSKPLVDDRGEVMKDEDGIPLLLNEQERAIDEQITSGRVTFYYPNQVPIPENVYSTATSSQKLGLQEALVIVAPGSAEYATVMQATGVDIGLEPDKMFGVALNAPIYPGGIVVLNNKFDPTSNQTIMVNGQEVIVPTVDPNNEYQVGGVMHEMSHAGEHAIINLTNEIKENGRSLPESVQEGANTARALTSGTSTESRKLLHVGEFSEVYGHSVAEHDQYVNQWTEVVAYSNQYPEDKERSIELLGRTLREMDIPPVAAEIVARDIVESEAYQKVREELDAAADYLLEQ